MYDGHHSYSHQLNGLKIAEKYFGKDCIILVDDTNWDEPRKATLDFIKNNDNNYEIIFDINTYKTVHPTFWNGIMVIKKVN